MCGLHIVVHADELEDLINYYQDRGKFLYLAILFNFLVKTWSEFLDIFILCNTFLLSYEVRIRSFNDFFHWLIFVVKSQFEFPDILKLTIFFPHRLFRWADELTGGLPRPRTGSHGHVHRVSYPVFEIQTSQTQGTPRVILVTRQHSKSEFSFFDIF